MGEIKDRFLTAFREFEIDGLPSSKRHRPVKSDIRSIGTLLETAVSNAGLAGMASVTKDTRANLEADLSAPADTVAFVYADSNEANNDLYVKTGASGTGEWANTGALQAVISGAASPFVEQAAEASTAGIEELGTRTNAIYPTSPVPTGTSPVDNGHYVWETTKGRGRVVAVEVSASSAGTFQLGSYTRSEAGQFTRSNFVTVTVPGPGIHRIPVFMEKPDGDYLGFRQTSAVVRTSSGADPSGGWWYGAALPFTSSGKIDSFPVSLRAEFVALDRLPGIEASIADISSVIYQESTATIGLAAPIAVPTVALDNGLYALEAPVAFKGSLTKLDLNAVGAGNVRVIVFSRSGNTFTAVREQTVEVTIGAGVYDIALPIDVGQYVGFQAPAVVGADYNATAPGQGYYSSVGVDVLIDDAPSPSPRLLIGFTLSYRTIARDVGGSRPSSISLPWENMFIPGHGQSLMEGTKTPANSEAPITTSQEFDNACLRAFPNSPTEILPATVSNSQRTHETLGPRGEWPGLGGAYGLRRAIARDHNITQETLPNRIIVANNAVSSQTIAQVSKGSAMFASAISQASAIGALTGKPVGVPAVWFGQGESDGPSFSNTDPAVYRSALKTLASDFDTDLRAATGQIQRVPTIAYQVCSADNRRIGLAQLQASLESDLLHIACPMYQFDYYDYLHINAASSRHLGGYYGEATAALMAGVGWEPLRPISAQVLGSTVTLTFNRTGLAIDTTLVPEQAGKGFFATASDGSTQIAVTGVQVVNGNQVRLTLASAPTSGATISYGVPAVGIPEYGGGAGNLRDAAGDIRKIDSLPLHNWCVLFDWAL